MLYAALFGVSSLIIFGILYWIVSGSLNQQAMISIEADLSILEKKQHGGKITELEKEINQRVNSGKYQFIYYLLQDRNGRTLAGNISSLEPFEGWREISVPYREAADGTDAPDNPAQHKALTVGKFLPGGYFLAIGRSTYQTNSPLETIRESFFWAMGLVLLLAFGGGTVISLAFLRQIDNINRTVGAINDGSLSERIPTSGTEDELDKLAKNLNKMLDRIQALMESLQHVSSNIAHDLRTPLGRMRQRLEIAGKTATDASSYQKAIKQAIQEIDAILSTFGSLLRIANIEAKSRGSSFSRINLSEVFRTVAETYQPVAEDMNKRIEATVVSRLFIHGDRDLLIQMLANLVENAIEHTPSGTTIQIGLDQTAQGPVGRLADDGPGIPACERDKIFERFYRLDNNRTAPGNGLGLALVKAVADLHGATISLGDNHPGAAFSIQFRHASS